MTNEYQGKQSELNYDKELIQTRIEEFKSKDYSPADVFIYFDLDNTLALFSIYGSEESAVKAMFSKGFFKELSCFSEAPYVLENLKRIGFKVKIISSCIDSPFCRPEKMEWVNYHLPFMSKRDIIFLPNGESKSNYIKNPAQSILVDDYNKNIMDIYRNGGVGIKKTYTGKERPVPQIGNLVDIFAILYDLKCF